MASMNTPFLKTEETVAVLCRSAFCGVESSIEKLYVDAANNQICKMCRDVTVNGNDGDSRPWTKPLSEDQSCLGVALDTDSHNGDDNLPCLGAFGTDVVLAMGLDGALQGTQIQSDVDSRDLLSDKMLKPVNSSANSGLFRTNTTLAMEHNVVFHGKQRQSNANSRELSVEELNCSNASKKGFKSLNDTQIQEQTNVSRYLNKLNDFFAASPIAHHLQEPTLIKYHCSTTVKGPSPPALLCGYLRFFEDGDSPWYTFSVSDTDEVFFARANKVFEKNCEWLYTFHLKKGINKAKCTWNGCFKEVLACDIVGEMLVSNKVTSDVTKCVMETQFVLFGDRHRHAPRKVVGSMSEKAFSSQPIGCKSNGSSVYALQSCPSSKEHPKRVVCSSRMFTDDYALKQELACSPLLELAAIIINFSVNKKSCAGWGARSPGKPPYCPGGEMGFCGITRTSGAIGHCQTANGEEVRRDLKRRVQVNVTVVLPAGLHGLPKDGLQGPTSLIERWRGGGVCDCGGWDEGCGILVLRSEPIMVHTHLGNFDSINVQHPTALRIFTQSRRPRKMLLLGRIEMGLFFLRFHNCFSPLQAFATAMSIFHQHILQA